MQLYDDLPRPQGTHADPAFTTYAELPSTQSYPPSYRTDNLPPDPDGQPYNQAAAYSQQHILPFSSVPPPPAEGASLVKRLSLLLPAQDPNYKSPEQIAEEDKTLDAEEKEMLKRGMFDWNEMRRWRFWIRKEWWGWYIALVVCGVLVCLMTLYNEQIIAWLRPFANKLKELPGGWAIPIGIMFVISFPPLFGHEVVMILCGVVWGLWVGFAIVCAGTFLGEMGNFYAFKYWLREKAAKLERTNMNYALLAHVVREGGLKIAVMLRLSAVPGHLTTPVLSTAGLSVWIFAIGTILSLPKNLAIVYLGVALANTDENSSSKAVEYTVIGISFLFSILAAWYIYWYMNKSRLVVWRKHRANLAKKGVAMEEIPQDPTGYDTTETKPVVYGKLEDEDDDASRPILDGSAPLGQTTSIASRPATMYASDAYDYSTSTAHIPLQKLTSRPGTATPPSEHDLGSIPMQPYHPQYTPPPAQFPEPVPHYHSTIDRQASTASSMYHGPMDSAPGYPDVQSTAFPVPQPYESFPQPQTEQRQRVQLVDPGYGRV
ncbi:hypothetical protein NCC49_006058 [Naganishia albida]|nr:hypothetical protein NCC49_006058 [Naganishia albida]